MKPRDLSIRFLSKASQDELVLDKLLEDLEVSDEVWGFHAQQAAEKLFKAVLSFHSVRFRKTHDLTELMDFLIDYGIQIPDDIAEIRELTPFAVEYRYDDLFSESGDDLNRKQIRELIQKMRVWVNIQINQ